MHENVDIFAIPKAGEVICRIGGKPDTCTVTQWQIMVLNKIRSG